MSSPADEYAPLRGKVAPILTLSPPPELEVKQPLNPVKTLVEPVTARNRLLFNFRFVFFLFSSDIFITFEAVVQPNGFSARYAGPHAL
jgi:hypothetical protein